MGRLVIAFEYTRTPGPRYKKEGEDSGEVFRKTILVDRMKDAIEKGEPLSVVLDGTAGFGTSFLEESFGGLIREEGISYQDIKKFLILVSEENPDYIEEINGYIEDAHTENQN